MKRKIRTKKAHMGRCSVIIRATRILLMFQNKERISVRTLVSEFGFCDKTARRWIMAVQDAGLPIYDQLTEGGERVYKLME